MEDPRKGGLVTWDGGIVDWGIGGALISLRFEAVLKIGQSPNPFFEQFPCTYPCFDEISDEGFL